MLSGDGVMERRETHWVGVTHGQVPRMPPGLDQGDTQHKEGTDIKERELTYQTDRLTDIQPPPTQANAVKCTQQQLGVTAVMCYYCSCVFNVCKANATCPPFRHGMQQENANGVSEC